MKGCDRLGVVPTITEVAHAAGVSRATAARVLGGYGTVGDKTSELVESAAKRLGYRPNQLAQSVATGRSNTIGVILSDTADPCFGPTVRAIMDTCGAHGFGVMLEMTDQDIALERDAVRDLLAKQVDGLIIAPASSSEVEHLIDASQTGCPVVLLHKRLPVLRADTFAIDNFGAASEAVELLVRRGHRSIALVSNAPAQPKQMNSMLRDRIDGYRAALQTAEMLVSFDLTVLDGREAKDVSQQVQALRVSRDGPTAFLATNSSVALLLLQVLRDIELPIPEAVSLICFDDADWTDAVTPRLTVISQPMKALATAATERLIARLKGTISGPGTETLMPAVLISRASVGDALQNR